MKTALPRLSLQQWIYIAFFNLLLATALGVTMRYKIAFSLPFVDQKNLLNAHSHFAFAGWISQALMAFISLYISENYQAFSLKKYNYLLLANLITAYGMLISFPFTGYGLVSIIFSTLSIFVSYAFAVIVWRDLNRISLPSITHSWIKAALFFNVLSSIGPFTLAYMMATKNMQPNTYLAALYFFLHFEYNGWFFCTCMGLVADKLTARFISLRLQKIIFYAFALACVPAYFLSVLWLPIPVWLYIIIVMAAFAQVLGWGLLSQKLWICNKEIFENTKPAIKYFFCLSAAAVCIKLLLQLGSTIPALSTWAFGFRPIVIGYLHLVFLGIFSIFIIAYTLYSGYTTFNKNILTGAWIFIGGILFNEALLMLQGFVAVSYKTLPYINELLFTAACVMFAGVLILNINGKKYALE